MTRTFWWLTDIAPVPVVAMHQLDSRICTVMKILEEKEEKETTLEQRQATRRNPFKYLPAAYRRRATDTLMASCKFVFSFSFKRSDDCLLFLLRNLCAYITSRERAHVKLLCCTATLIIIITTTGSTALIPWVTSTTFRDEVECVCVMS